MCKGIRRMQACKNLKCMTEACYHKSEHAERSDCLSSCSKQRGQCKCVSEITDPIANPRKMVCTWPTRFESCEDCSHIWEHVENETCKKTCDIGNCQCTPTTPSLLQAILEFGDPEVRETATTECPTECTIDVGYDLYGRHVWCTSKGVKEYCAELVAEYRKMQETVRQQREQIITLQRSLAIESYERDGGC